MGTAASLVVRIGAQTGGAIAGIAAVDRRVNSFARSAGRAMKAAGAGIAFGLAYAVKKAIDFDRQMRNVNSIAHVSERQFGRLKNAVRDMGKTTGQGPAVLAAGLYDIVSSGFRAADALKILKVSAVAATAGQTDTATASKAVVAILNAYHLAAGKAKNVSSLLFEEVNKGVNTFEELAQNIGDTAPMAAALKIPFHEIAAGLALITKHGTPMAEGSTQMARVLTMLFKPSKDLKTELHSMGFESGQAAVKALGFVGVLNRLSKDAGGNAEKTASWAKDIRALRGMLNLTGPNIREYNDLVRDMGRAYKEGGRDQAAFKEQSKSLGVQWDKTKAQIEGIAIRFGTKLFPVIRQVLPQAVDWITKLAHGAEAVSHALGGWGSTFKFVVALAGAAKLRGLLLGIAGIAGRTRINLGAMLTGGVPAGRLTSVGRSMGSIVGGAMATGISLAVTAGVLAIDWARMAHDARRKAQATFAPGQKPHTTTDQDIGKMARTMFRQGATGNQVMMQVQLKFGSIRNLDELRNLVSRAARSVRTEIPNAFSRAQAHVKTAAASMAHSAEAGAAGLKKLPAASKFVAKIGPEIAKGAGQAKAAGAKIGSSAAAGVRSSGAQVSGAVRSIVTAAGSAAKAGASSAGSAAGAALGAGVAAGIDSQVGAVQAAASRIMSAAASALKVAGEIKSPSRLTKREVGKPLGEGIVVGFLEGTRDLPSKMSDRLRTVIEQVASKIGSFTTSSLVDRFTSLFDRVTGDILSAFDANTDRLMSKLDAKYARLTKSEKALKALTDAHDEEARQRAISDAQRELASAIESGDAERIKSARQALNDAMYDEQVAALEKQAEAERKAQDKKLEAAKRHLQTRRDLERRHLEDQLAAMERYLERHPKAWARMHGKILRLMKQFGVPMKAMGAYLGKAFIQGLNESFGAIGGVLKQLMVMIRKLERLLGQSKHGKPKQGGGAGGADRSLASSGGGGGGTGDLIVNVNLDGKTVAKVVVPHVRQEFIRHARRNLTVVPA